MNRLIFANEEKDKKILFRAINNSNVTSFGSELVFLETGEDLVNKICKIIKQEFSKAKKLGVVSSHYTETREGEYKNKASSLVIKWGYQKPGLLEMWSQLGAKLARSQCFTNGNKRTALLSMISFCHSCGFLLVDDINNPVHFQKWEKLLVDIAIAESEELAIELIKERILNDIKVRISK